MGLPSGADGLLKRTEVVPKREGEVDVWGLARSPFVTGKAHMRGDPAGGYRFVVGVEVTK